MTTLEITELDPLNQAEVDQWCSVTDRSLRHDMPDFPQESTAARIVGLTRQNPAQRSTYLLAKLDGVVVGQVRLDRPLKENLRNAEIELDVDPRYRRRGVATALLARVERLLAADDRNIIHTYVPSALPGGPPRPDGGNRFAELSGFDNSLQEIHRRADLDATDPFELNDLLERSWEKAAGYELVQWINAAPDDLVDNIAYLDGRLLQDAPTGELELEAPKTDAARIRDRERERLTAGRLTLNTGVRHIDSGRLAGWTDIVVDPGMERDCWQGITLVDPQDRGHRIGTILKIENHRLLRNHRPKVSYVHTWNAEENDFMININEAVGYRPVDRWTAYQKKL